MISTDISTRLTIQTPVELLEREAYNRNKLPGRALHMLTWICLFLACLGASWFSYQYELVPQPKSFLPNWHDAQWVGASDGNASTAYFRYETALEVAPDNAFVTIAASQVFSFYVNGTLVGTNSTDFGSYPRSYIYEVTPSLILGVNVLAIRVDNLDGQKALLRASFGVVIGNVVAYYGTGKSSGWLATDQTSQVYSQNVTIAIAATAWTGQTFMTSAWLPVEQVTQSQQSPGPPLLTVNPLLYEQPVSTQWVSAGPGQDSYFVRQISIPKGATMSWLRLAATGTVNIFINGNLSITWNYRRATFKQITVDQATGKTKVKHKPELVLGVYDVSPFLHPDLNTFAIHISLPNVTGLRGSQGAEAAALSLDVLTNDDQGHFSWFNSSRGWQVSHQEMPGWTTGANATSNWTSPTFTERPDGYSIVYVSKSNELTRGQQAVQSFPILQIGRVMLLSVAIVLGLWLLVSLVIMRRYFLSSYAALEMMGLAYLPALAYEGLLIVISKEPQVAQPFPFTATWGLMLAGMVATGYILLGLFVYLNVAHRKPPNDKSPIVAPSKGATIGLLLRFLNWLWSHWPLILLVLLTIPLVFYDLGYEAYWQDELVSYLVAKSIQHTGLPMLPSGFIYPKGELYSYLLALFMNVFGDQNGAPRIISGVEYLLTLVLLYRVGCYFFDKHVALSAAILLAFSPHELIWARQMRMYQEAQLLTLLTVYLFYRAVQERHRISLVYLATVALIITYLSHEETFIIMPALVLCLLFVGYIARDRRHHIPSFFYQKHWWIATGIAATVIGVQLLIVRVTHPPVLGTDNTSRPMIQATTNNIAYYLNMLFIPTANDPSNSTLVSNIPTSIILDSILMVMGVIWAMKSKNLARRYIALFFVGGFLTLMFMFTMQADRYFYPLATFYYLLTAFAFVSIVRAVWMFAKTRALQHTAVENRLTNAQSVQNIPLHRAFPLKLLLGVTASLAFLSVLLLPMFPLNNYNLFVSRLFNLPYYHHFGDYNEAGQYIQHHMRQGDIVISIIPDSIVMYYAGQSDYFFSINHALFLFEQKGHIVDTYTGKTALLHQSDLDVVLDTHARIWLFSADNHYQNEVLRHFIIPPDFHVVYSGANSIVYLRGG